MLITKPRVKLGAGGLSLGDDLLSAVSLGPSGVAWVAVGSGLIAGTQIFEDASPASADLIVTSVPREYWPDLWRLDVETHDEAGIIALLAEIFSEKDLVILNAEGAANGIDSSTQVSFIFSAARYRNSVDRNSDSRRNDPNARLRSLEFELTLNLLDASLLALDREPRVKVRRMKAFQRLDAQVATQKYTLLSHDGSTLAKRRIKVPQRLRAALETRFDGDIYYSMTADTKDRLVRGYFFGERDAIGHLQVDVPIEHSARALRHVADHILKNGGNVIRYRLQNRFQKRGDGAVGDYATFEVSFTSIRQGQSNDVLTLRLFSKFDKDTGLREMGVCGLASNAPAVTAEGLG